MLSRFIAISLCAVAFAGCNAPQQTTAATSTRNVAPAVTETTAPAEGVAARPDEATGAFVRGIHVVPGTGPMELRDDDNSLVKGITFGNSSSFVEVPLKDSKRHQVTNFGLWRWQYTSCRANAG